MASAPLVAQEASYEMRENQHVIVVEFNQDVRAETISIQDFELMNRERAWLPYTELSSVEAVLDPENASRVLLYIQDAKFNDSEINIQVRAEGMLKSASGSSMASDVDINLGFLGVPPTLTQDPILADENSNTITVKFSERISLVEEEQSTVEQLFSVARVEENGSLDFIGNLQVSVDEEDYTQLLITSEDLNMKDGETYQIEIAANALEDTNGNGFSWNVPARAHHSLYTARTRRWNLPHLQW